MPIGRKSSMNSVIKACLGLACAGMRPRTSVTFATRQWLLRIVNEAETVKNPVEVLRRKEAELERLQEEVEALRLVGKLLREQILTGKEEPQARGKILQMP